MNFNQDIIDGKQIVATLDALKKGGIKIDSLVIDGLDFSKVADGTISALKKYAEKAKLTVWFSVSTDETSVKKMFTPSILDWIDTVIYLEQGKDAISMQVLKMRDEKLPECNIKLDSKTLLMAEK